MKNHNLRPRLVNLLSESCSVVPSGSSHLDGRTIDTPPRIYPRHMKNPNLRPRLVNLRRSLVPLSHREAPILTTEPSTLPSNVQNWKNPNLRPRLVNLCRSLPLSHREGPALTTEPSTLPSNVPTKETF